MSEPSPSQSVLAFSDFLAYLRGQGFAVDAAHYMRLQTVLDQARVGRVSPDDMARLDWTKQERPPLNWEQLDFKTLLCPIFATTREEQERFYKLFDEYLERLPALSVQAGTRTRATQAAGRGSFAARLRQLVIRYKQDWRRLSIILGAALLVVAALLYFLYTRRQQQQQPEPQIAGSQTTANTNTNTDTALANNNPPQMVPEGIINPNSNLPPVAQTNTNANENANANTNTNAGGNKPADVNKGTTPAAEEPVWGFKSSLLTLALLLTLWGGYELSRYIRRRRILARQHDKSPPDSWPLSVETRPEVYATAEFYAVARRLRRRQVGEFHRLDVKATVAATVKAFGYLTLREKPDSKPPEYLLLIDRAGARDHQAYLFGELAAALKRENIFLLRFFYDGDPRTCYDGAGGPSISLSELQTKYAGHRLLIFGEGASFIDPLGNEMEEWTRVFEGWRERTLLTNTGVWGAREIALATRFIVLPAGTRSLLRLPDLFVATMAFSGDRQQAGLPVPPLEGDAKQAVQALRRYLGADAFLWLCACAVAPQLQWELTLRLGTLPFLPAGLVNEANLMRLARLNWFRKGAIPDEVRWQLIQQLSPEQDRAVRRVLIELLQHAESRPPARTYAAAAHQLELLGHRWASLRDRASYRRLLEFLRTLPPSQVNRDRTLLHLLKLFPSAGFARRLSPGQRDFVYSRGLPGFGPSAVLLCALALILNVALFATLSASKVPDPVARLFPPQPVATPTATPPVEPAPTVTPFDTNANTNIIPDANVNTAEAIASNNNQGPGSPVTPPRRSTGVPIRPPRPANNNRSGSTVSPGDLESVTPPPGEPRTGGTTQPSTPEQGPVELAVTTFLDLRSDQGKVELDPSLRVRLWVPDGPDADEAAEKLIQQLVNDFGLERDRIDTVKVKPPAGLSLGLTLPVGAELMGTIPFIAGTGMVDTMVEVPDLKTYGRLEEAMKADANAKVFLVVNNPKDMSVFTSSMSERDIREKLIKAGIDPKRIVTITASPTSKKYADGILLFVQPGTTSSPQGGPSAPALFDKFSILNYEDAMARLDNFAVEVKSAPGSVAYIISYGMIQGRGRTSSRIRNTNQAAALNMAKRYKNYLISKGGFDEQTVRIIDGGKRAEPGFELFIIPPGGTPPTATPDAVPTPTPTP
ncbi:MAG TPA: hypothetical protein VJT09_11160 [Pyrinomonadaceae bacterium]|nr:hypothetical protein [Pyrinomonadaceae bacterium]